MHMHTQLKHRQPRMGTPRAFAHLRYRKTGLAPTFPPLYSVAEVCSRISLLPTLLLPPSFRRRRRRLPPLVLLSRRRHRAIGRRLRRGEATGQIRCLANEASRGVGSPWRRDFTPPPIRTSPRLEAAVTSPFYSKIRFEKTDRFKRYDPYYVQDVRTRAGRFCF